MPHLDSHHKHELTSLSYFLIPETKGIPLERMDELFEIKPTHKAHGIMVDLLAEHENDTMARRDEKAMADEHITMA